MSPATSTLAPPERAAEAPLPRPIDRKLRGLRAHLRRIDAMLGLTRTAMALAAFAGSTFVLDRLLDLPVPFRAVLLALGVTAAAFVVWRHLLRPLSVRRTDDEVALLVERAHPELNDELISAVQLSRALGRGGRAAAEAAHVVQSEEMVQEVVAGAAAKTERIDFGRVADTRGVRRLVLLTLVVLGLGGAFAWKRERDARSWFERAILLRDTPWPRTVELDVSVSAKVVAKGDDVTVVAQVLRGAPSRVAIHPVFEGTGRGDEIAMAHVRGEWTATVDNVNEPFRFYVEGGDYKSRWLEVQVRARPKLEEIRVWLVHPPYTGIADTPAGEPLRDGNLKVPGGTLVRYEARATEPLKVAEVGFSAPQAIGEDLEAPAIVAAGEAGADPALAAAAGEARLVRGAFRVKDSTAWTVRLVSREGFESPVAAQYQIRAIPDKLPDVRIVKPGRNKDVARRAAVDLRVEVRDDYMPKAAALVYAVSGPKRGGGAGAPAPEETRVPLAGLPSPDGAKSVTLDRRFDLEPIGLEPGDRVTYWVEAVDNRAPGADVTTVNAESRGRSERYVLSVVGDDDLERQQQAALKRIRDDLVAISKEQARVKGQVEEVQAQAQSGAALDPKERRKLTYAELDQRKVAQRLEAARRALGDVKDEKAANKVGSEEDRRWVGELESSLDGLLKDQLARASKALGDLRTAEKPDPAKLADVAKLEGEAVETIQDIVRSLDKWDEYNEVVRDFRDLLQAQERIKKDTQDRFKQELPK